MLSDNAIFERKYNIVSMNYVCWEASWQNRPYSKASLLDVADLRPREAYPCYREDDIGKILFQPCRVVI